MRLNPSDLQARTAIEALQNTQSTHGIAAQASAAKAIRLLRETYPSVTTGVLAHEERVSDQERDEVKYAQGLLEDYINIAIGKLGGEKKDVSIQKPASIANTCRVVDQILKLTEGDNPAFSCDDAVKVLKKMLAIAKTHPGGEWSKDDDHWSKNEFYHSELTTKDESMWGKSEFVIASPAEALNLVSSALLDSDRYLRGANPGLDRQHRIESLFNMLKRMYNEENATQREYCASGTQHELIYLLNGTFLTKPSKDPNATPLEMIVDVNSSLMSSMTLFLEQQLEKMNEKARSELLSDWVLYQAGFIERDEHPFLSAARELTFSENELPTDLEKNPDFSEEWQHACEKFLKNKLIEYGIDPNNKILARKILDNIESIENLPPPAVESATKFSILHAKKINPGNEESSCYSLILHRNAKLEEIQNKIKNDQVEKNELQDFFKAEEYFQAVYAYKFKSLMLGANRDDFWEKQHAANNGLIDYYDNGSFSDEIEQIFNDFAQEDKRVRELGLIEDVENLFLQIEGFSLKKVNESIEEIIEKAKITKDEVKLTDSDIENWLLENGDVDHKSLDISSYDINRILIHALVVKPDEWSEKYVDLLTKVTEWLSEPSSESHAVEALKKSYPKSMIDFLHDLSVLKTADIHKQDEGIKFFSSILDGLNDNSQDAHKECYRLMKMLYELDLVDFRSPKPKLPSCFSRYIGGALYAKDRNFIECMLNLHDEKLLTHKTFYLISEKKKEFIEMLRSDGGVIRSLLRLNKDGLLPLELLEGFLEDTEVSKRAIGAFMAVNFNEMSDENKSIIYDRMYRLSNDWVYELKDNEFLEVGENAGFINKNSGGAQKKNESQKNLINYMDAVVDFNEFVQKQVDKSEIDPNDLWDLVLAKADAVNVRDQMNVLKWLGDHRILDTETIGKVKEIKKTEWLKLIYAEGAKFGDGDQARDFFISTCSFVCNIMERFPESEAKDLFHSFVAIFNSSVALSEDVRSEAFEQFRMNGDNAVQEIIMSHEDPIGFAQRLASILQSYSNYSSDFYDAYFDRFDDDSDIDDAADTDPNHDRKILSKLKHPDPLVECLIQEYKKNGAIQLVDYLEFLYLSPNFDRAIENLKSELERKSDLSLSDMFENAAYLTLKSFNKLPENYLDNRIKDTIISFMETKNMRLPDAIDKISLQDIVDIVNKQSNNGAGFFTSQSEHPFKTALCDLGVTGMSVRKISIDNVRNAVLDWSRKNDLNETTSLNLGGNQ